MLRPVVNKARPNQADRIPIGAAALPAPSTVAMTSTVTGVVARTMSQTTAQTTASAKARSYLQPVRSIQRTVPPLLKPVTPTDRHSRTPPTTQFSYRDFAKQLARRPQSTGAIAPSSRSLARAVVRQADLANAKTVVELGPGTGAFTEEILKHLSTEVLFFALELNPTFVQATKERCPDARVYHAKACSLPGILKRNKQNHADCIISSLPWTIFDEAEQNHVLEAITTSLKPGGVFVSIVYLGAKFRARGRHFINRLPDHFTSVRQSPTVWQNLPPTQIYRCIK